MLAWLEAYIASVSIFTPAIFALFVLWIPNVQLAKWVGLLGAGICFLATLHMGYYFQPEVGLQFVERYAWLPQWGISYFVGVDGISLLLILLTSFLTGLLLVGAWRVERSTRAFFALLLFLESGMLGALMAFDLVFFYVFWEVMLIPMYFLIGVWGGQNRIYATTKFVLYTVFGSLLMLVAAICLYLLHKQEFGVWSTSLLDLYRLRVPASQQTWLFAAFALAFAIKIPLWPFHTWLPHAHTEAPTTGSVILAGVLLKMGTYGFLRFAIPLFPVVFTEYAVVLSALGVIGILYGALVAWRQPDAKKMVAYSSVSHLGFVMVGLCATVQSGLSVEALTGAVYQMINHGISTGMLFFLVGVLYDRRHTRMLADFGGLAKPMPWFAVLLIIATLGSVGLPGTGGFVGEFLILLGTFQSNPAMAILASSGVLLGAVYMLTLCRKVLFGPITHPENENLPDISGREALTLAPLALLVIGMGIFPNLFLQKVRPSIEHMARTYMEYRLESQGGSEKGGVL